MSEGKPNRNKPDTPGSTPIKVSPPPPTDRGPMSDADWAKVEAGFGTFDFDCDPAKLRRQQT